MGADEHASSPASSTALRPEMVEAAKQFMSTPKVRSTPFETQKQFLLEKGVTEAEIEEAQKFVSNVPISNYPGESVQPLYYQPPPATFGGKLYSLTQSVVVIGGASYMAYRFMRSWVLPKFFNVPEVEDEKLANLQTQVNELQNSTKFIMDSVEQTLASVSAQQEQLNRALMLMNGNNNAKDDLTRLQTDLSIVKSLLLNQNQFPAIPTANSGSSTLNGVLKPVKTVRWQTNPSVAPPSWQLASNGTTDGSTVNETINGTTSANNSDDRIQSDDELYHEAQYQVDSNGHN
uniref:Peroxisomal membrane protein PEX14 n=1 Tax=Panagrolaimus sp. JU765 TaxID=591449 RepID=A0AC34R9M9_9BILA